MALDERLVRALLLLNQVRRVREDVQGIDPEARGRSGGSGISACVAPVNSLFSQVREVVSDVPTIAESIGEVAEQVKLQERLNASYHWRAKYGMLIGLDAMLAALETYLQLRLPLEEKQRIGFVR